MQIAALTKYQKRRRDCLFEDLAPHQRLQAQRILERLCAQWRGRLPRWRYAILVGRAKDRVIHPRTSAWGRHMLAIAGGRTRQRHARVRGINPTQKATLMRLARQTSQKPKVSLTRIHPSAEDPRLSRARTLGRNTPDSPPSAAQQASVRMQRFLALGTAPPAALDERMWPPGSPIPGHMSPK
jgi:hypothetical protein